VDDGPFIRIRRLSYWYPGTERAALDEVDLEVGRGEFVLLVGSSGSGKSTLLRSLNGLVPRYHGGRFRGSVEVDGRSTVEHRIADMARLVGLVFQDPERQAVMSRVDNEVAFGLESLGIPPVEIPDRVHRSLRAVDLDGRSDDMVSELSSGQAQRLALASVLAMEPEVLALDEPTSQLDPNAAWEFLASLDRERRQRGATVLLAEHRLERCLPLVDRVVVLDGGRVAFDGTPAEFIGMEWERARDVALTSVIEVVHKLPSPPHDLVGARDRVLELIRGGEVELRGPRAHGSGDEAVTVEGLRFSYVPGEEVLRGVDLGLHSGEVLVLVGPNGSGKTTLARHLNGLLRPASGSIRVRGRDITDRTVADLSREVALLTQNPGDYLFERSVRAELRLTAQYRGLEGEAAEEGIAQVVLEMGLDDFMDRFSWDLSAGQRQRVALGALLVGAPEVLVLDEPTRGMDGAHKEGLATFARGLAASGGSVLLITHDMEFAARAGDRFAVLEEGRVAVEGPPDVVFEARPEYMPALWRATEGLGLSPEERPMSPSDLVIGDLAAGGGSPW
jgi:energy-coupling factor transport system ATP-binding protein